MKATVPFTFLILAMATLTAFARPAGNELTATRAVLGSDKPVVSGSGITLSVNAQNKTLNSGKVFIADVSNYRVTSDIALAAQPKTNSFYTAFTFTRSDTSAGSPGPPQSIPATMLSAMCGDYTVGTGGDFPSLTGAGGLFEAINSNGVACNINVQITSDLTEAGTFSLNEWLEEEPGNYTLTIVPADNQRKTISGSTTNSLIRIDGAQRVIIDGGTGKNLLFRNSADTKNAGAGATIQYLSGCADDLLTNCIAEGNLTQDMNGVVSIQSQSGNFNITISNNEVRNTTAGFAGSPTTGIFASVAYADSLKILGNNIYNWKSKGIFIESVAGSSRIANNSLYYNMPVASTAEQAAIFISGSSNPDIRDNFIGGQAPFCAGQKLQHTGATPFIGIFLNYSQASLSKSTKFFGPTPCQINHNTIQNINIEGVAGYTGDFFTGIRLLDGPADIGNQSGNLIGSSTLVNSITINGAGKSFGVYTNSLFDQARCENNTISHVTLTGSAGSAEFTGIYTNSGRVNRNKISNIAVDHTALTPTITGIFDQCNPSFSNMFANNLIALDGGTALNPVLYGMRSSSGNFSEFHYNSVSVTGPATQTSSSFAFYVDSPNAITANNNIFSNSRIAGGIGKHYALFTDPIPAEWQCDYNDLYSSSAQLAHWNGSDIGSLSIWRTATGGDMHSVSVNPLFVSASDLHTNVAAFDNTGISIPDILTDLEGNLIADIPDMGCYQFSSAPIKTLNLTLFLEGLYTVPGTMHAAMDGLTGFPQWGDGIADKITIQLHEATSPYNPVGPARVADLLTNGTALTTISGVYTGNYYIAISHRNSITTWSASPVSFASTVINYNFSNLATKAYGNNLKGISGTFVIYAGDADADGAIIDLDLLNIEYAANGFLQGYLSTDINGDGMVDVLDLILADTNAGKFVMVKKP